MAKSRTNNLNKLKRFVKHKEKKLVTVAHNIFHEALDYNLSEKQAIAILRKTFKDGMNSVL